MVPRRRSRLPLPGGVRDENTGHRHIVRARTAARVGLICLLVVVACAIGLAGGGRLLAPAWEAPLRWAETVVAAWPEVLGGRPPPASEPAEVRIAQGETLLGALTRAGVPAGEMQAAILALRRVHDPRRLRAGQALMLEIDRASGGGEGPRLVGLSLDLGPARTVRLERGPDGGGDAGGFSVRTVDLGPSRREPLRVAGEVGAGGLYASARRAALPSETVAELVRALSRDVDLERDLRPGARFEAVLERAVDGDGDSLLPGRGLAFAALALPGGRRIEAYRFAGRGGRADYFDAEGRSLRKALLRTPVDGARLSSRFGMRRHPVLGYSRMHKGVDFAAPSGTPVYAAGDGEVEFVGRNRGYGRYVRIRHDGSPYSTAYAHLSRFAPGLKPGDRVAQGQLIGHVGASGLATGPHLHYEVLEAGRQVDPMGLKTAYAERLEGAELARFRQVRARIDAVREAAAPDVAGLVTAREVR